MDDFNIQEAVWADQQLMVFGAEARGARGFKFSKEFEKELLYAAGNMPVGAQYGNKKFEGSLKALKSQVDDWNDAAFVSGYDDITEIPPQAITATVIYKPGFGRPLRGFLLIGIAFSKLDYGWDQGAKFMELELPFIFLGLKRVS